MDFDWRKKNYCLNRCCLKAVYLSWFFVLHDNMYLISSTYLGGGIQIITSIILALTLPLPSNPPTHLVTHTPQWLNSLHCLIAVNSPPSPPHQDSDPLGNGSDCIIVKRGARFYDTHCPSQLEGSNTMLDGRTQCSFNNIDLCSFYLKKN